MPPVPFHQLSDEPLYCEAVHDKDDDGFYSGSEDDHYEGPLHRRLRIEKKAIDFLSGNVPILISAALRGPFDRKQWNNPWRSTRAELRSEPCQARPTLSRHTTVPEEDLPDTQGTSLYPLPSPETTNPPSAGKNPYMDEQDYSRVKTWREAIKSTSASKDPFWQSQQGDKDEKLPTRKRSADSTWLHKRDRKKPRSAIQGNSSPDDSPSRCAARNKDSQTGQLHASRMIAHFLRNSSPPEDELARDGHTRPPGSNISPLATKAMGMTPHRWAVFRVRDNSDDELSLPATTPTSKAIRVSTVVPASSTGDRSPSRRKRAAKSKSGPPKGGRNSSRGRAKPKKPEVARPSPSQGPSCDETGAGSHVAAQTVEAAPESMDVSPQNVFTTQSEPLREQLLPDSTSTAKSMFLPRTLASLPSTQQDNSFLFHKRARIPTVEIEGVKSPNVSKKRLTLSPCSPQLRATKMDEREDQSAPGDDPAAPIVPGPESASRKSPQVERNPPIELPRVAGVPVFSPAVDEGGVSSNNQSDQQTQCTAETETNDETKMANKSNAEVEPDARNDSAEMLQLRNTNEQWVPEDPQSLPQGDDYPQSHSEWSTYLDTEDRTPASATGREISKKSDGILVVECGVDGASDPEWSTFVSTQDITPVISNLEAAVNPEQVTDQQVGSDETTLTNLECLPPVFLDAAAMDPETAQTVSVSECSPGFAGHTGETPGDSTPGTFPQDQMHSQASVGSIIDAYAEFSGLSKSSEPGTTEKPGAEHLETEAEVVALPCSLPNQPTTVPADGTEVHNEIAAIENPRQLRATLKESDIAVSQLALTCDRTKSDENPVCEDTRNILDLPGPALQTSSAAMETASCGGGFSSLDESTASPEQVQLQSPWGQVATSPLQMPPQAPGNETRPGSHFDGLGEAATQVQSPWNTKADTASPLFGPLMACTSPAGSTPDLSILAGKALAMSQQSQSPWEPRTPAAPNPPAQDFEMSIRAFSDFMSPSPVKKRASSNTTFPRSSTARPGILFKTPAQRKTDCHVRFAPLPGEQETCFTEFDPDGSVAIYDEEEVSYFDPCGKKTGTMRMPKPTTRRAASPPPIEMSSVEVGELPDHDQKFAKHFEAISKRKNPNRKPLRLLPSESQQTVPASQEVGAMAEAFIQASQTRKRGLELAAEKGAEAECESDLVDKTCVPKSMGTFADQENVEPVDDVSLVLDNLDKFLDNTWGIDISTGESPANDACSKHEKELEPTQGVAQKVEDQMYDLEANVWAD